MAQVIQNNEGEWVLRVEWCIEDVRQWMEESGADQETMTDDDCLNVLKIMADKHDAEVGINWDVLDAALGHYYFGQIVFDKAIPVKGAELVVDDEPNQDHN
jgi:hypothetical protein